LTMSATEPAGSVKRKNGKPSGYHPNLA
jgi:hypothetical protein